MKNKNKITLLGGDQRQYTAAVMLKKRGWDIDLWGMYRSSGEDEDISFCDRYTDAVADASAVILPLPASVDGVSLNCPFCDSGDKLRLSQLLDCIEKDTVIIGGRIPA